MKRPDRSRALLLLGIAMLMPPLGLCQDSPSGPPATYRPPPSDTITLENGVQVTFVSYGNLPKATIAAKVRAGSVNEGNRPWLANLTADLLREGTESMLPLQMAEAAAFMGGSIDTRAGEDITSVTMSVLSECTPDAVELLAKVVTRPLLPEGELPQLKQKYVRALSVQQTQPGFISNSALSQALYPGHPYGNASPTAGQLQSYTIHDIRTYYKSNFGSKRTHVYIVGTFDRSKTEGAVRATFGQWRDESEQVPSQPPPPRPTPRTVVLIDRPGSLQSALRIGIRVPDPTHADFMPVSLANAILGGSLMSRLVMNLRETKGWTYSPRTVLEVKYHQAAWIARVSVGSAVTGLSLVEISQEIEKLRSSPPSLEELTTTKNYVAGTFVISTATRAGLIDQLAWMHLQGLTADWLATYIERLYSVTPEDVRKAAHVYLDPSEMSVVVVGDLTAVRPQIEATRPSLFHTETDPGNLAPRHERQPPGDNASEPARATPATPNINH